VKRPLVGIIVIFTRFYYSNPVERDKYLGGVTMYIILKEVHRFLDFYDRVSVARY